MLYRSTFICKGAFIVGLICSIAHSAIAVPDVIVFRTPPDVFSLNRHLKWLCELLPSSITSRCVMGPYEWTSELNDTKMVLWGSTVFQDYVPLLESLKIASPQSLKIVYSMFESSAIPQLWTDQINTLCDAVVVPDEFLVTVYKNSGVNKPIFVIPHGSYLEEWLEYPQKTTVSKPFVFATSGSFNQLRKNHDLLIEAFLSAFGDRQDVVLKIHAQGWHGNPLTNARAADLIKRYDLNNRPNISFHYGDVPEAEHRQFLRSCDCYINISSGEGFSITPREALAVGIPVIITDNTAQTTVCKSGYGRVVPCTQEIDADYGEFNARYIGKQQKPTLDAVVEALKDVYEHYQEYLDRARQARPWLTHYCAPSLIDRWATLFKPRNIIFGSRNEITADYLMTDSVVLYEQYKTLIGISQ